MRRVESPITVPPLLPVTTHRSWTRMIAVVRRMPSFKFRHIIVLSALFRKGHCSILVLEQGREPSNQLDTWSPLVIYLHVPDPGRQRLRRHALRPRLRYEHRTAPSLLSYQRTLTELPVPLDARSTSFAIGSAFPPIPASSVDVDARCLQGLAQPKHGNHEPRSREWLFTIRHRLKPTRRDRTPVSMHCALHAAPLT